MIETAHFTDAPAPLPADRGSFRYLWPYPGAFDAPVWTRAGTTHRIRALPESAEELAEDSRWPVFFPSAICIATASHDGIPCVEKIVGASIVNRFPYTLALSLCREPLSERHYRRNSFMQALEASHKVAVQFLMPGPSLRRLMTAIATVPEDQPRERMEAAGLGIRMGFGGDAPVFDESYLVYHGRLVSPGRDFHGAVINDWPWIDVGSHRIYFFRIETIALRDDIAHGDAPLHWRSLPVWRESPSDTARDHGHARQREAHLARTAFTKTYRPDYVFPGPGTIAFEADEHRDGFAVQHLRDLPQAADIDNDQARWPCFFPSSVGMITIEDREGRVSGMSCGSTTIIARHPLTLAICVSYARINERYAPRASLDLLRNADRFGCGVPIYRPDVLDAISYLGNISHRDDPEKLACCGLTPQRLGHSLGFAELPVHFDCRIVGAIRLGTHMMYIGQAEHVLVHRELSPDRPLEWCPWAGASAP